MNDALATKLAHLPTGPGVYQHKDAEGAVLYVGKAKNLRNRVRSYFQESRPRDKRLSALVSKIADLEIIVTDTEAEALILENNLIKQLKPRYNVNLKDDKTYPWIVVTNERFPRVFPTRRVVRDGSKYFGPYTDVKAMYAVLEAVRSLFKLRTCSLNLAPEPIAAGKFQACLEFHIQRCAAPCIGLQSEDEYLETIRRVEKLLNGQTQDLATLIKEDMQRLAAAFRFEDAAARRDQLKALDRYAEKQKVIAPDLADRDLFALTVDREDDVAVGVLFKVREGKVIGRHHRVIRRIEGLEEAAIMQALVEQHYTEASFFPNEVLLSHAPEDAEVVETYLRELRGRKVTIKVPERGDKAGLMRMAELNAELVLTEWKQQRAKAGEGHVPEVRDGAAERTCACPRLPRRIECFDISHLSGTGTVASCVVFEDGMPKKSEYRHFKIRTLESGQIDDFASMREIVARRYSRVCARRTARGPTSSSSTAARGSSRARSRRSRRPRCTGSFRSSASPSALEELFFPGDTESILIPRTSASLHLVQRVRNEAHRFAVTFQRKQRQIATLQTELTDIPGVGPGDGAEADEGLRQHEAHRPGHRGGDLRDRGQGRRPACGGALPGPQRRHRGGGSSFLNLRAGTHPAGYAYAQGALPACAVKIALCQINPTVGDLAGNAAKIQAWSERAASEGADLAVFPELCLVGYPPLDLLDRPRFLAECAATLDALAQRLPKGLGVIVGAPRANPSPVGKRLLNAALLLEDGQVVAEVYKQLLPTYDVFDEYRYFEPAPPQNVVVWRGLRLGLHVCEDMWNNREADPYHLYAANPVDALAAQGVDLFVNVSGSPFATGRPTFREAIIGEICAEHGVPLVFVNEVGANTELIFDGGSGVWGPEGPLCTMERFGESFGLWDTENRTCCGEAQPEEEIADLHDALVLGIRDYVGKSPFFSKVLLGLSGGIDSALTAALAAEALGPDRVVGVTMPSAYSSEGSVSDSLALAQALGLEFHEVPIVPAVDGFTAMLAPLFAGRAPDVTEENLQARTRGTTLMALSNKFGYLLLTTGNKSEMAVGYATLYGDMNGGLAVLSDVFKLDVYRLARYINAQGRARAHPREHPHESPLGRAAARPERPGQPAALRGARPDLGALHRGTSGRGGDRRRHRGRPRARAQAARYGGPQRIQAPPGRAGPARHHESVRAGPPPAHRDALATLGRARTGAPAGARRRRGRDGRRLSGPTPSPPPSLRDTSPEFGGGPLPERVQRGGSRWGTGSAKKRRGGNDRRAGFVEGPCLCLPCVAPSYLPLRCSRPYPRGRRRRTPPRPPLPTHSRPPSRPRAWGPRLTRRAASACRFRRPSRACSTFRRRSGPRLPAPTTPAPATRRPAPGAS